LPYLFPQQNRYTIRIVIKVTLKKYICINISSFRIFVFHYHSCWLYIYTYSVILGSIPIDTKYRSPRHTYVSSVWMYPGHSDLNEITKFLPTKLATEPSKCVGLRSPTMAKVWILSSDYHCSISIAVLQYSARIFSCDSVHKLLMFTSGLLHTVWP